ncbi:MAG: apolipoprotein N-acyltransferase [Nitrospirae bacterium]|nr:apolipoprotein N-acyltransferase [Nitrospirota bacterium]
MKNSVIINIILSALSALLLSLSFPMYDIEILAWIGIIPLLFVIKGSSPKIAFLWSWFSGTLFSIFTLNWLTGTMSNYGGLPYWISLLVLILLSAYVGLYTGFFGLTASYLTKKTTLPFPLLAAPVWVSFEYIRAHLLTGFPWASLGYSQYKFLHIIQIADITSLYGISFLIIICNAAIFELFSLLKNKGKSYRMTVMSSLSIFSAAFLFILSLLYGNYKLKQTYYNPDNNIKVAVIQGDIPQHLKWDRNFQRKTIDIYEQLTEDSAKQNPAIVIWPETAAPFFFQERSVYQQEIYDLAKRNNISLLFGSPSYKYIDEYNIKLFNSAYLISPDGRDMSRYDKMHLVPFGEYVPLSKILFFLEKMVVGIGDFMPGKDFTVLQNNNIRLGTVICFEVIFPDLVRKFVLNGAEFMTTITNDAWFGKTSAPYQHFSMVVFRAVENRVYFARAANTGISGFISPAGEILNTTPIFVKSQITQKITPSTRKTFYTLYGDIFAYLCIFIAAVSIIAGFKGSRDTHISHLS